MLRSRLVRGVAATAIAVAIALTGGARPAEAQEEPIPVPSELEPLWAMGAYVFKEFLSNGGKPTQAQVAAMALEIINIVRSKEVDITAALDAGVAVEPDAEVMGVLQKIGNMGSPHRTTRENYATEASRAGNHSYAAMRRVMDPGVIDQLGRGGTAAYTIAVPAFLKAGWDATVLMRDVKNFLELTQTKMRANCNSSQSGPAETPTYTYRCDAYDGTTEVWSQRDAGDGTWWNDQGGKVKDANGRVVWTQGRIENRLIERLALRNTVLPLAEQMSDCIEREGVQCSLFSPPNGG